MKEKISLCLSEAWWQPFIIWDPGHLYAHTLCHAFYDHSCTVHVCQFFTALDLTGSMVNFQSENC